MNAHPQSGFWPVIALILFGLILPAGCARPSVGVGYHIPGTPVSIGTSVPIGPSGAKSAEDRTVYRQVAMSSQPAGAEIYVNNQLVGATPTTVSVPFEKGFWGGAKGSAMIVLKRDGYLPEGFRLFAAGAQGAALTPSGLATTRVERPLRRAQ